MTCKECKFWRNVRNNGKDKIGKCLNYNVMGKTYSLVVHDLVNWVGTQEDFGCIFAERKETG